MLSDKQKNVFREIWKQRFGREIPDEDVDREANRLVRIVQLICKSMDKDIGDVSREPDNNEGINGRTKNSKNY
jgi:hypothetical protein